MSDVVIEASGVCKKFKRGEVYGSLRDLVPAITKKVFSQRRSVELQEKEFWALKDVSFQVEKGEAVGIIGPNGAGKSTMLKLFSGILRPNKGHIAVKGRLSALIEVGAGFHPDLTGKENIYLNGAILGMTRKEIDNKLEEIVEFSGLSGLMDTPVKRYSSGMYARLGFSVAAHVNPDLLLVDEVLSVGDMKFQQKCIEKMKSVRDSGSTIIFISHNFESVNILCPKTIFLQNGQIKNIGKTPEVIKEYVNSARSYDGNSHQEVTINNIILADNNNALNGSFIPGDKARISLEISTQRSLKDCLLGFLVHRVTDGISVCDYNLPLDMVEESSKSTPLVIEFDMNLLRGAYAISFHILSHGSTRYLNRTYNAIIFTIEERVSWQGISHLNPVVRKLK